MWQKTHEAFSPEETWARCRDGLVESARHAGERGVTLALQNHAPVIGGYRDVLRMVGRGRLGALEGLLRRPARARQRRGGNPEGHGEVGPLQVLSHYGGEYEQGPGGIKVIGGEPCLAEVSGLLEIGYRGYFGYELCHPLPVVDGKTAGVEYVHENVRLAAEYMRGVITDAKRQRAAGR